MLKAVSKPSSLPPSGVAGGDLSGTYPNPTVAALGASVLSSPHTYTAQQNFSPTSTLTSSSNHIAWNLDTDQVAKYISTEDTTLDNPTNMVDGGTYIFRFIQDSTPRTLAFGNAYKWPGGTPPVVSTGSGAIDIFSFTSDGVSMFGNVLQNFS